MKAHHIHQRKSNGVQTSTKARQPLSSRLNKNFNKKVVSALLVQVFTEFHVVFVIVSFHENVCCSLGKFAHSCFRESFDWSKIAVIKKG